MAHRSCEIPNSCSPASELCGLLHRKPCAKTIRAQAIFVRAYTETGGAYAMHDDDRLPANEKSDVGDARGMPTDVSQSPPQEILDYLDLDTSIASEDLRN